MTIDLVIRGGTVVDGSGSPGYRADVAVKDERIVKIGRVGDKGVKEIDAEGHIVSPGFIDGHTHMDAQVMWDSLGSCSCYHGITSVVIGNCGFTLAPARPTTRDLVVANIERAEDISGAALAAGIDWSWETYPQYLDAIDRVPKGINYASQIGHSALRTWVMGERAFESSATDDEIQQMERIVEEAIRAGAIGFTTSRGGHLTTDDRPVASRQATWEELDGIVAVLGRLGTGVFELARESIAPRSDVPEHVTSQERLRSLALRTGVPITFGAHDDNAFAYINSIVEAGGKAFGMTHSRGMNSVASFRTQMPFDVLPEWRTFRSKPLEEQRRILSDPAAREKLVRAAQEGPYGEVVGAEVPAPNYETMRLLDSPIPPNPTIADLARAAHRDPVEFIIDLVLDNDFDPFFIQPLTSDNPDVLRSIMRKPHSVMTFSDAGAHVSQLSDCSIQTHLLAYWVRQVQEFSLEEAVRMITHVPATYWNFQDRGLLKEGYFADLAVFDPDTVGPDMPKVVADLPGGGKRLLQKAKGIRACIVAGEPTIIDGEPTGSMTGRLLRGPLAAN
jgi:N-acyl-D-amino-acid deacylase